MANFDALFAGCESFMESDIETDDEGVYTSEGDALEAESVAEDVGTEGGEITGEAETEDTKAEAANMVFDQLMNMYTHVKNYGVDRTFLSLYNSEGQLNQMIGYKFPSCESIDSVGNINSSASRAFIVAMEEDGIFKRIWTWIKETIAKVYNFFIKVMDWFREACGNLDLRVGKLYKYFNDSTPRRWGDIKDKSIKYISKSSIDKYLSKHTEATKAIGAMFNSYDNNPTKRWWTGLNISGSNDLLSDISNITQAMSERLKNISSEIKSESTRTDSYLSAFNRNTSISAYGSTKDKDDEDGAEALKKYLDRINKDVVDPLADAISDISLESSDLEEIDGKDKFITISLRINKTSKLGILTVDLSTYFAKSYKNIKDDTEDPQLRTNTIIMLESCKKVLKMILQQKQAMDMMNLANKQAKQLSEQESRHAGNGSLDYEAQKDARLSTMGIVKGNSIFARIATLNEKMVAKCCTLAAGLQGCVKPNSNNAPRVSKSKTNKP